MKKIYLLSNEKHNGVTNLEIFKIEYLDFQYDLNIYDALIFTSKNAVKAINRSNKDWKNIPSYSISKKTSSEIIKCKGKLAFSGNSTSADKFAYELIDVLRNKKVLYIKALKTVSNLVETLKKYDIEISELVAYKTSCKESNIILEDNSIFIFTSPSCINCFFSQYEWNSTFKAVAIGKTTAKFFPSNINYIVSNIVSIENCIKIAKTLL